MSVDSRTRSVGEATVTIFNVGDLQFDLASALGVPSSAWRESDRALFEKPLRMCVQCVAIHTPETTVLVDAAVYDLAPNSEFRIPDCAPPDSLLEQMAAAGIEPESVKHVVITHAHFDHFNGLTRTNDDGSMEPAFPRATVYLGRSDWEGAEMRDALESGDSTEARTLGYLDPLGALTTLDGRRQISPGVEILPAPGETPGHLAVRVESQGQVLYCLGDLYHHAVEVEHQDWAVTWADQAAIRESRSSIVNAALREDALLVATHIQGFGRLAPSPDGVRWEAT